MSFKSYLEKRVMCLLGRPMKGFEYDVFEATLHAIGDDARQRARHELLAIADFKYHYTHSPAFHQAMNVVIDGAVNAVLHGASQIPDVALAAALSQVAETAIKPLPSGASGLPAAKATPGFTMAELQQFAAQLKEAAPKTPKKPQYYVHPALNQATWVDEGAKPYVSVNYKVETFPPPVKEEMVDELLRRAESAAAKLKAEKLREGLAEKYEKLTGKTLSPEEAEQMIIKAIEEKEK